MVKKNKVTTDKMSVLARTSKAIVDDYYRQEASPTGAVPSLTDMNKVREAVFQDEEVRGFVGVKVDSITASGYQYIGNDSAVKNALKLDSEVRIRKHLKKIVQYACSYLHVFIELVPSDATKTKKPLDRKVVDWIIWSPNSIKPIQDKHGKLLGYAKNQEGNKEVKWSPDEMKHLSVDDITDSFWTIPQIITLYDLILLKAEVWAHLKFLYGTNQFRQHFHAKDLAEDDVKAFTAMIKEGMADKTKFLITVGNEDMQGKQLSNPADMLYHIDVLNKIRNNMLTVMRVPPIIAGTVDNSNRSNSDIQARFAFTNTMKSLQSDIEDEMNNEILPATGIKNAKLKFNSIDIKNDADYMKIAQQLIISGASPSKTVEWLNSKGMDLPNDIFTLTDIEKTERVDPKLEDNSTINPSRNPQDKFGSNGFGINENQ